MGFPIQVPVISIYSGDDFTQSYRFLQGNPATAYPFEEEGWGDWVCQWRATPEATTFVAFTVNIDNIVDGDVAISLSAADTVKLSDGFIDLQATANGITRTWLRTKVNYVKDISRV